MHELTFYTASLAVIDMGVFTIIVSSVLVSILWLPTLLCAIIPKRRFGKEVSRLLWLVLPAQLIIVVGLVFLAQHIGMLNPAGYVFGITVFVSLAGSIVVTLGRRVANQSAQQDALQRGSCLKR